MDAEAITYGSDQDGLVYGFLLSDHGPGKAVHTPEAQAWIQAPTAGFCLWLHFNLANAASKRWMQEYLPYSQQFLEFLEDETISTRVELVDNVLMAVINDVLYDFRYDPESVSNLWVCVQSGIIVTARARPLRSIDRLRACVRSGDWFRSSVEVLAHLMRDQADVLVRVLRGTSLRIDAIEDNLLAPRIRSNRTEIGKLRRLLVRLQRLLAPEPAALFRLLNRPPDWATAEDLADLRQSVEELSTSVSDMASLTERARLLQEELVAQTNEQANRNLFVLTMVTVLALPINILAGLFGMNVGGIPFAQHKMGFWIILAIITVIMAAAAWWAFRRRDS